MKLVAAAILVIGFVAGQSEVVAPPRPDDGLVARSDRGSWLGRERDKVVSEASGATRDVPRLTIARLQYDGGGDWYANPSSLPNLLSAIRARTTLQVERTETRVTLMSPELHDYPFVHMTGHGNVRFTDAEVVRLRRYLERGGFLHADDNYGLDESFRREIARVFPDRPLRQVPLSHPVYNIVYSFPRGLPKIHEHDGKPPQGLGIFLGDRLVVFYSHETDLGNGWEDRSVHGTSAELHEAALRMGVNLFVYAMTSRPGQ